MQPPPGQHGQPSGPYGTPRAPNGFAPGGAPPGGAHERGGAPMMPTHGPPMLVGGPPVGPPGGVAVAGPPRLGAPGGVQGQYRAHPGGHGSGHLPPMHAPNAMAPLNAQMANMGVGGPPGQIHGAAPQYNRGPAGTGASPGPPNAGGPPMGGAPQAGFPQMGTGPPQMGAGPPQMGGGPQMGGFTQMGGPPRMGGPPSQPRPGPAGIVPPPMAGAPRMGAPTGGGPPAGGGPPVLGGGFPTQPGPAMGQTGGPPQAYLAPQQPNSGYPPAPNPLNRYPTPPGHNQGFAGGAPHGGPPPPMGAPMAGAPNGFAGGAPIGGYQAGGPQMGSPGVAPYPGAPTPTHQPGGPYNPLPAQSLSSLPSTSNSPRIDPAQIPRPVHDPHAVVVKHDTRNDRGGANHPPAASTTFCARDLGSANPRYMRCTMSTIPNSGDLCTQSGMPLTLMVQPLALPHPDEAPILVVEHAQGVGPVRCGRCKAYMNAYNRWVDHGRFCCVFCNHTTECPQEYMCNLGPDGRRGDASTRPELHLGSVEYAAPNEYMVRPPMAPALFFVIDVNPVAVQTGATTSACEAIARTLAAIPEQHRTLVGICAFDAAAHFFKFPSNVAGKENETATKTSQTVKHLVVPDVEEPYSPLPTGLAVPLQENMESIKDVLAKIPEMFASGRHGLPCGVAAIKACVEALKPIGGRVVSFIATMPSGGYGAVKGRTAMGGAYSSSQSNTSIEKEPLKHAVPFDKVYCALATEAAEYQVGIDVFVMPNGHCDVASLGHLCRVTGGSLYRYGPVWSTTLDFAQLHNDLRWNVTRPQGMEAVMRVRASTGLNVSEYGGFFCKRTPTDVDLPTVDCDKAISVDLRYEDKLTDGSEAYLQCALLYTTVSGQRRIRVHTLAVPVSSVLGNVFRACDLETQTCSMIRKACGKLLTGNCSLQGAKDASLRTTVDTLYAYRKFCASNNSTGQLILPEGLKVLPLYCLAMHKSDGLRLDASADDRAFWLLKGVSSTSVTAVPSIYPRNFPVHDLPGVATEDGGGGGVTFPPLPTTTWLSAEKLEPHGVYVLEDGSDVFVWVGKETPRDMLQNVFGVTHVDQISAATSVLPRLDNQDSRKINLFVDAIRRQRSRYMKTRVVKRGDPFENAFYKKLIEDRSPSGMSYVEFLCHVHRLIQNKFQ